MLFWRQVHRCKGRVRQYPAVYCGMHIRYSDASPISGLLFRLSNARHMFVPAISNPGYNKRFYERHYGAATESIESIVA